jgi:hypothetical protein
MRAHGQDRQAKHALGTVTHAGTWAGQTGKADIWDRHTGGHRGGIKREAVGTDRYEGGSKGGTGLQAELAAQIDSWAGQADHAGSWEQAQRSRIHNIEA